ncbi:hypothetical protein KR009_002367 [Drosophila setifemur]|nr:hypothetical protein KR009_002367 [Drosophila setifemur]
MSEHAGEISMTFGELQAIDQEDIIIVVDVDSALQISKECLASEPAKTPEVLSLWLNKLLRAYLDEAICCFNAFKEMCEWFQVMVADSSKICTDHNTIVADSLKFLADYKDHLLRMGERLVHGAAFFLFNVVKGVLQESEDSDLNPTAVDLHLDVLTLLKDVTAGSRRAHARITALVQQMNEITGFLSSRIAHLQAYIKTSELMTYISLHFIRCDNEDGKHDTDMPQWLKETILHLCDTVLNHLETIYKKDILVVPVGKVEEFLKVTRTYLLRLHEIFKAGVNQVDSTVSETLLELLMSGATKLSHDLGRDIPLLLATYIKPYVMQVYELIYSIEDFQKYFISCLLDPEPPDQDYFDLCMDCIAAVSTDTAEITPNTSRFLQKIFEYLFKDAANFVHPKHYERVIDAFGTFLYLGDNQGMVNYFCHGLFEKDIIVSQVCVDILMLLFRLKEDNKCWNTNTIDDAIRFWNKCNNAYAVFSQNPSQWHVQRFLKYFHSLGKKGLPPFTTQNFRYLTAVCCSDAKIGMKLLKRLEIISSAVPTEIEIYYEVVALLELLAQQNGTDCSKWFQQAFEMSKELLSREKCTVFASAYFNLLTRANQASQLLILQGLSSVNGCPNWHRQKFLHTCKTNADSQLRAFAVRHSLEADFQPILTAMLKKPDPLSASNQSWQGLSKSSYARERKHTCPEHSLKRKRTETKPKQIILDLYESSLQLGQCRLTTFDANDRSYLDKVVANLTSILSRH